MDNIRYLQELQNQLLQREQAQSPYQQQGGQYYDPQRDRYYFTQEALNQQGIPTAEDLQKQLDAHRQMQQQRQSPYLRVLRRAFGPTVRVFYGRT